MKRLFLLLLALVSMLCFGLSATVAAEQTCESRIIVDGQPLPGDYAACWNQGNDRLMVEATFFEDYLQAEVNVADTATTVAKNGHMVSFQLNEDYFVLDGIGSRILGSPSFVTNGKTYLPLRFMCESLGAACAWDEETQTVAITTGALTRPEAAQPLLENVAVFDQASIRITGEKTIYIDPYRIAGEPHDADLILVTHPHGDHFDVASINKLMKESTVLCVTEDSLDQALENGFTNIKTVAPNQTYTEDSISFKTVPAYNTSPDRQNHKEEYRWVGYIVTVDNVTYYAAGDTDYIPDMDNLEVDVAFLPIDGRYNMDELEATQAANAIAPKIAVPYHYNNFASVDQALHFISLLDEGIMGVVLTFQMY